MSGPDVPRRGVDRSRSGVLELDHVWKTYQGPEGDELVDALADVSIAVGVDEAVGVIGPNGAGKTTILKLAAGVTSPTSGTIRRSKRAIAVIELGAGIHTDLTGRENIELLMSLTMDRALRTRSRFDEIVDFSDLHAVLDQPARHYSSGMVARLAFSVAAHADPDLLLIDEVLSVGDLSFQRRCRDRIFELRSAGTTVMVVSHDLDLIADVCERTVLLVQGRVELDGATDPVIGHYLGQPLPEPDADVFPIELLSSSVESGQPVEVEIDVPAEPVIHGLRLEFVVPAHIELRADQGSSTVCGTTWLPSDGPGRVKLELATAHLPPGRYELHVALEDASRAVSMSAVAPFSLLGPPGPVAIRLSGTVTLGATELSSIS